MFGGVFSVHVNNPHLRKSGSRLIIPNLGENDSKSVSMLLATIAKLQSPVFLQTLKHYRRNGTSSGSRQFWYKKDLHPELVNVTSEELVVLTTRAFMNITVASPIFLFCFFLVQFSYENDN